MQQQQQNNSNSSFRNGPVQPPSSQGQSDSSGGHGHGDTLGSNGDQYFSATFNSLGIQDFPSFAPGSRARGGLTQGPSGKLFSSTPSGIDQLPDDFNALNLAVGNSHSKSQTSTSESSALPHSSSTSSFASYASMFGPSSNTPVPPTNPVTNAGVFGGPPNPDAPVSNSAAGGTMFGPIPQNQASVSTAKPASQPMMFVPNPQNSLSTVSHITTSSSNGLVYSSPVSPAHSPRISPSGSPLAARRMQSPAMQPTLRQTTIPHKAVSSNLVQESVGGTTYFYSQDEFKVQSEPLQYTFPAYAAYTGMPSHIVHLKLQSSVPQYFSPDELKLDHLNRQAIMMMQIDPSDPSSGELPSEVDNYTELCPLERPGASKPSLGNLPSTTYKAVGTKDGLHYCLRRIHGFRLANTKVNTLIESWKKMYHPNIVQLKEVFTTKAFNDNSIVFVYDYHPGSETLMSLHFSSNSHLNGYSNRPHHHHHHHNNNLSRDHGKHNNPRNNNLLAEGLIWTYIVQLSSALRAIHAAGLAVRSLEPSKILVSGKARLRINCVGIMDIITPENNGTSNILNFKQDDLTAMGRIVLALACNNLACVQRDNIQPAIDHVQRSYSPDLKNLVCYLLQNPNRMRSVNDVMPMIGARFFTHLDTAHLRSDVIDHEMSKEIENGRLLRILMKLGFINERPEYSSEPAWAETGDRFMLKLFRDYLFHQVDESNLPWLDLSHVILNLNKFDAGLPDKVCLTSRDENSMLVVSYSELKRCFQSCFQELVAQPNQASFS